MSTAAGAATLVVANLNDSGPGSLRDAITIANSGDTITFNVTGTIALDSPLSFFVNPSESAGSLTITGPTSSSSSITIQSLFLGTILNVSLGFTLNLQNITLANGVSSSDFKGGAGIGGAINNLGSLTITNSTFSANRAIGQNGGGEVTGGIGNAGAILNSGTLTITNSTFSANQATGGPSPVRFSGGPGTGGAISNYGTLVITNSTFSANQAIGGAAESGAPGDGEGGAIFNQGKLTITNTTFFGNQAINGDGSGGVGGAIDNVTGTTGTVDLKGTILAASTPGNCGGTAVIDAGYNLSDDDCRFSLPISHNDVNNIGLASGLADNGGPTQTIALLATSPAVDAVPVSPTNFCTAENGITPIATDQRGVARPQGPACDIGAFELVQSVTPTPTATSTPTPTATATSTPTATPTATATPSAGRISASTNPITLKGKPRHPKSKQLKVKNIGTGPLDVTGTAGLSASLSSSGGGVLAPKKSLRITVTDSPTTGGSTVSQTLKILSNDPTKPEVDITVTGTSP